MTESKQGKIIKGIAGFYYVHVPEYGVFECKAKGAFRNQNIRPLVGDDVCIDIISLEDRTGNVMDILPRANSLIRPAVANVDQAVVIFSLVSPKPNLNLLDRFLIMMEQQQVPSVICLNKLDLASVHQVEQIRQAYGHSGYPLYFFSAATGEGVEEIRACLAQKTSTVAGPSGAGKSTLINRLAPDARMETGEVSRKIQRGRHTTRHSELIALDAQTYIFDTPGFSSLSVDYDNPGLQQSANPRTLSMEKEELAEFFPEFLPHIPKCRFRGCAHRNEPDCGVRAACQAGLISQSRYDNYSQIYQELSSKRKYK